MIIKVPTNILKRPWAGKSQDGNLQGLHRMVEQEVLIGQWGKWPSEAQAEKV
jgi:hypothetical protein